ncbi:MAG: hypothetical protein M1308_17715 [Actinobacteria bacterium]|nr:hypothetical protein [Actinomycetota bacterium]
MSLNTLVAEFGRIEAYFLKNIGSGIDFTPVVPYTIAPSVKSVGRNFCLPHNEYNQRVILQNIFELCEEISIKLRRLNKKAKTIGLALRGTNCEHGRKTIRRHIDSGKEIFSVCKEFYNEWFMDDLSSNQKIKIPKQTCPERSRRMVRMISVWAENLEDKAFLPLHLFEIDDKKERVLKAVDKINERFGDHTIRNGFLLYSEKLTTVPNGFLADKYERFKLAPIESELAKTSIF